MIMLVLVSGASLAVIRYSVNPYLGRLTTPACGTRVGHDSLPWAADNGCFNGLKEKAFLKMLVRIPAGALFLTVPDVVGDHAATLDLWCEWRDDVAVFGVPAFVLQDGCDHVPDDAGAVFIGGSTAFKLGATVRGLVRQAKRRGLWVHMGRVNTRRRLFYAESIGCDSVDGTAASMFPDTYVPKLLRWAEAADRQGDMFS